MLVSAAIRSGASLPLALRQMSQEMAAPCGQEFELMLREQRLGVTLDEALGSLERRMGGDDLRLFTAAVRIAGRQRRQPGGDARAAGRQHPPQADRGGEDPRAHRPGAPAGLDHDAAAAGGRCRAFAIEPEAMEPLIATWQGWVVCGVIAVLELAGLVFIRRIMDIDI